MGRNHPFFVILEAVIRLVLEGCAATQINKPLHQTRRRYNRDQKASGPGKLDSVSPLAPAGVWIVWHSSGTVGTVNS